jgi:hypothetical protein
MLDLILNPDLEIQRCRRRPKIVWSTIKNRLDQSGAKHTLLATDLDTTHDMSGTYAQQLGFLEMLSLAYSQHRKVEIAPHDLWYIVLCELATYIKGNVEECRPLFTKSAEKVSIVVPTDDPSAIDLNLVLDQLRNLVPLEVALFVPELSTLNTYSRMSMYAALCDGLQHYYNYMTFCCGIPAVRIMGTLEDWETLSNCVTGLMNAFADIEGPIFPYLIKVQNVFGAIVNSYKSKNPEFFLNIFTQKNVGSGGELDIDGWITDLYLERKNTRKLENFLTSFATVPYTNLDSGKNFKAVYGAFLNCEIDEHLRSTYGSFVFQVEGT